MRVAAGTRRRSAATRERILEATASVIRARGFVGATTSAIADEAGVNQGVIFYHFGSLTQLFGATLESASAQRLEAYRTGLQGVEGVGNVLARAVALFDDDRSGGYVTVLTELVAGASAIEELRPVLVDHVEQWIGFVEGLLTEQLRDSLLAAFLPPPRELAVLVVSIYLGAELLVDLAPAIGSGEALTGFAARLAGLVPGGTT